MASIPYAPPAVPPVRLITTASRPGGAIPPADLLGAEPVVVGIPPGRARTVPSGRPFTPAPREAGAVSPARQIIAIGPAAASRTRLAGARNALVLSAAVLRRASTRMPGLSRAARTASGSAPPCSLAIRPARRRLRCVLHGLWVVSGQS